MLSEHIAGRANSTQSQSLCDSQTRPLLNRTKEHARTHIHTQSGISISLLSQKMIVLVKFWLLLVTIIALLSYCTTLQKHFVISGFLICAVLSEAYL